MSKKRDKNKRKKQLKDRSSTYTKITKSPINSIVSDLGYEITDEPIDDKEVRELPTDIQDQMDELFEAVQLYPENTVETLIELTRKYPHIPQIFNFLYAAYANTGQRKKAVETMKRNYESNPNYLFAMLNYSDYLVECGEVDKVGDVYDQKFCLSELYPSRRKFHTTEVVCFHGVIGYYYAVIGEYDKASYYLKILEAVSPYHNYTQRLARKLEKLG